LHWDLGWTSHCACTGLVRLRTARFWDSIHIPSVPCLLLQQFHFSSLSSHWTTLRDRRRKGDGRDGRTRGSTQTGPTADSSIFQTPHAAHLVGRWRTGGSTFHRTDLRLPAPRARTRVRIPNIAHLLPCGAMVYILAPQLLPGHFCVRWFASPVLHITAWAWTVRRLAVSWHGLVGWRAVACRTTSQAAACRHVPSLPDQRVCCQYPAGHSPSPGPARRRQHWASGYAAVPAITLTNLLRLGRLPLTLPPHALCAAAPPASSSLDLSRPLPPVCFWFCLTALRCPVAV